MWKRVRSTHVWYILWYTCIVFILYSLVLLRNSEIINLIILYWHNKTSKEQEPQVYQVLRIHTDYGFWIKERSALQTIEVNKLRVYVLINVVSVITYALVEKIVRQHWYLRLRPPTQGAPDELRIHHLLKQNLFKTEMLLKKSDELFF